MGRWNRSLEQIRACYEAKQARIAERQKAKEESYQERAAVRYKKHLAYHRARCAALTDGYIANTLLNVRIAECPYDLIELKRQQMKIFRLTKQLNETLQEISHE